MSCASLGEQYNLELEQAMRAQEQGREEGARRLAPGSVVYYEQDPNGIDQHAAGAKLDAGKPRVALVLGSFARALWAVSEVGTFGANKYSPNGWKEVENGFERYSDAGMRHFLKQHMGESDDPDSELPHLAHEAWNALARLEFFLRAEEEAARADEEIPEEGEV